MHEDHIASRLRRLEDRAALRALIDTFAVLSDRKDIETQVLLFTEDATVDSYVEGKLVSSLKGRRQLADAFGGYLALFDTVYHQNGQQTVEIEGDRAMGVGYCLTVLVGTRAGTRAMTTSGVSYEDTYARCEDGWRIAKRVTRFEWQRTENVG